MNTLFELQLLERQAPAAVVKAENKPSVFAAAAADTRLLFNPHFQQCLQKALSNNLEASTSPAAGEAGAHTVADHDRPSLDVLETYAKECWDRMLHWMVGASRTLGPPPKEVMQRLIAMGLMEPNAESADAAAPAAAAYTSNKSRITPSGFAFVFQAESAQVWDIVLSYMEQSDESKRDEVLQFLFRLSFLKLGMGYPTAGLTDTQRKLLIELNAFGLCYMKNKNATMYYPTRLALNLSSTAGASSSAAAAAAARPADEGYILLETTFRLYAFTTSPFHTALLGLFVRLDIALPNLLIGTITKESIRHALKSNISSTEIITYLNTYAKSEMRMNTPVLPENVTDQIRLWEGERNRIELQSSHLLEFDANDTPQVVQLVTAEALKQPQQVLLHHPHKKLLVVTTEGFARIKAFKLALNQQMAIAAQQAQKQV